MGFSLFVMMQVMTASPEVAVLCAPGGEGDVAELRVQTVGATVVAAPVADFRIVPRSSVTGVVLPHSRVVLATALTEPSRDETWAFSLVRLEEGRLVRVLATHVAAASRPVVTASGRVFVERGTAGPEPTEPGSWRVDELRIDEVNPSTGVLRTVLQTTGFFTSLVGSLGTSLIVYRSGPSGTRLDAIDVDTHEAKTLVNDLAPFAHDFAVDEARNAILFTQGDARTHRWRVERLDVVTLQTRTLATGDSVALLPTLFPNGRIGFASKIGDGLRDTTPESALVLLGPMSAHGFERVRLFTSGYAIGLHERPSDFPMPFAVSLTDGSRVPLVAPPGMRLDIAGVFE